MAANSGNGAQASRRLGHLDALRGIAAVSVMIYHYTTRYGEHWGHPEELVLTFPDGGMGVELFFCISGFVIYMTLKRCRSVQEFALKRCARLYPAYWFAVALTFTVVSVFGLEGFEASASTALLNLTMLNRFMRVEFVDHVYWSLTIELIFYFWMAVALHRGMLDRLHRTCLVWLAVSTIPTFLEFAFGGPNIPDILKAILLTKYWTYFMTGMLLFRVYETGRWDWRDPALIALGLLSLFLVAELRYVLLGTGAVSLFAITVFGAPRFLQTRVLVFLGSISYALYLVHQNIGYVIIRSAYGWGLGSHTAVALAVVSAVAIASAVTFWVEIPARKRLTAMIPRWLERNSSAAA